MCESVLCCLVTCVPNRCGNSGVVIAAEKRVPYGLRNPCSDWAAGTGEGTSPLSHDDLPREQRDRAVSQETSEASTTFLTSQRTTHVTALLSLHLCVYSPVHRARLIAWSCLATPTRHLMKMTSVSDFCGSHLTDVTPSRAAVSPLCGRERNWKQLMCANVAGAVNPVEL